VVVEPFKAIGVHQRLRSGRYRMATLTVVGLTIVLQSMQVFRLYLARHSFQMFADMAVLVVCGFLPKGYADVDHAGTFTGTDTL